MQAAVELFVEKGISATTTRDIAKRAKVAEGSLYRHFSSKDALATSIFYTNLEELSGQLWYQLNDASSLRENLEYLISAIFAKYEEEPELAQFLLLTQFHEIKNAPVDVKWPSDVFRQALLIGVKKGECRKQDVELLTPMIFGAVVRITIFRTYQELPDLKTLTKKTAALCYQMTQGEKR